MVAKPRLPVYIETRSKIKAAKRGGETYDDVLNRMLEQYDPDVGRDE